jgi:hypothetical protein
MEDRDMLMDESVKIMIIILKKAKLEEYTK